MTVLTEETANVLTLEHVKCNQYSSIQIPPPQGNSGMFALCREWAFYGRYFLSSGLFLLVKTNLNCQTSVFCNSANLLSCLQDKGRMLFVKRIAEYL